MSEVVTVYITKYGGEIKKASTRAPTGSSGMDFCHVKLPGAAWEQAFKLGRDCFLTEEEAIADIYKRRDKNLAQARRAVERALEVLYASVKLTEV